MSPAPRRGPRRPQSRRGKVTSRHALRRASRPQQRRGRDWQQFFSLCATLIAASGLIFAGWTAYYGVAVQKDQLNQSREQATLKLRQQASLVNFWDNQDAAQSWLMQDPNKNEAITMANRSLDPVHDFILLLDYKVASQGDVHPLFLVGWVQIQNLPPCTEMRVSIASLTKSLESIKAVPKGINPKSVPSPSWSFDGAIGISFVDVNGAMWQRSIDGTLLENASMSAGIQEMRALANVRGSASDTGLPLPPEDPHLPPEEQAVALTPAQSCA